MSSENLPQAAPAPTVPAATDVTPASAAIGVPATDQGTVPTATVPPSAAALEPASTSTPMTPSDPGAAVPPSSPRAAAVGTPREEASAPPLAQVSAPAVPEPVPVTPGERPIAEPAASTPSATPAPPAPDQTQSPAPGSIPEDSGAATPPRQSAETSDTSSVPPSDGAADGNGATPTAKPVDAATPAQPGDTTDGAAPPESGAPPEPKTVTFNLTILDLKGKPISGLKYRIVAGDKTVNGSTNAAGRIAELTGLEPDSPLEFFVRKLDGSYGSKYKSVVACADMTVCAVSPHIKIEVETEPHAGPAGVPPPKPPKPAASKAPLAPPGPIPTGGSHPPTTTQPCRTPQGNPKATVTEKFYDWAGRNHIPTFLIWGMDDHQKKAEPCTVPAYKKPPTAAPATPPAAPAAKPAAAPARPAAPAAPAPTPRPVAPPVSAPAGGVRAVGPVTASSIDQPVPPALKRLIEIMEEHAGWEWKQMSATLSSLEIQAQISNATFQPITGKPTNRTDSRCYSSVKVGLWRAGLVSGYKGDVPAKGAGAWLLSHGFTDVTSTLPDGRWALPGDVLVYRYSDAKEAKNNEVHAAKMVKYEAEKAKNEARYKEELAKWEPANAEYEKAKAEAKKNKSHLARTAPPKPKLKAAAAPENQNYGHIEVRTYDGYISDFKTSRLALPSKLVVIGIYRKICDPLADLRVRAYLEVIGSRETEGKTLEKSWYALNAPIDGKYFAASIDKHPWLNRPQPNKGTDASGRFQIRIAPYSDAIKTYGLPDSFLPANQQRIAVHLLEYRQALGLVRQGKLEEATRKLSDEWSALPGAGQNRGYSMSQLLSDHAKFMKELIK